MRLSRLPSGRLTHIFIHHSLIDRLTPGLFLSSNVVFEPHVAIASADLVQPLYLILVGIAECSFLKKT